MEMVPEQLTRLRELGLSSGGARAYVALLELGVSEARAVGTLARIPTTRVYKVLDQLRDKGLVEVTHGKPRSYAPIPVSDFLDRRIAEREDAIATLRACKTDLGSLFPIRGTGTVPRRSAILSTSGRRNVLHRFGEECRRVERDMFVLSTLDATRGSLVSHLDEVASRGVHVHVVRGDAADPFGPRDVTIATFDARLALFVRLPSARDAEAVSPIAIGTTEPAFVEALRTLLASRPARLNAISPVTAR